ncbi:MAG: AarF/ABC1/UbiB kinase family protein [Alphaproteobacteria bacterium]|nr:AarF/ABC1/UbiB kinase family protein [Alphaproteobacteria bacterium]
MADDQSAIGGRIKRYAKVTGTMGNLAMKMAGERYLGLKVDRDKHAAELRDALGGLKGPLMKVAQILATIPEALPREYAEELANLQTDAPSMGWLFVKRRMMAELGADWMSKFQSFEKSAAAAASLGQVHQSIGHDGTTYACKLQYPDMASAVEADLKQLKLILNLYERYDNAISTGEIHQELAERLAEELDYKREASNMKLYRHMLKGEAGANVPAPVEELSTDRLLTMTWINGTRLKTFIAENENQEDRNNVAINMFRTWYVPFYYYGVIHGDPHPGNYTIADDGSVNLLDYGCIRLFRPSFVSGVIDLYKAIRDGDDALAVKAYENWGFSGLDQEAIDVLNIWAKFIYTPLLEDRARPIHEMGTGTHGRDVAMKVYEELKRIGGVQPPREFVLMDRAAIGLGSVFMHLKAEVNWHQLFEGLIDDFDQDKLGERQSTAARDCGIPESIYSHS